VALAGCDAPPTLARGRPIGEWVEDLHAPEARRRVAAVEVLGNIGPCHPAALPALATALRDPDAKVRDAAVLALMKSGPAAAGAVPALAAACDDADPSVRTHAAAALARIRGTRGPPLLCPPAGTRRTGVHASFGDPAPFRGRD
jgi:HEAT repeat protein